MADRIEKVFTLAVEPSRAWELFARLGEERAKWEASTYEIDPVAGGRFRWTIGQYVGEGEVLEAVPEKLLRQHEQTMHENSEITVTFEAVESGTRITITHAGFGDGEWQDWLDGTSLGWDQSIHDLFAYVETGVVARRFVMPFDNLGLRMHETAAGLRVDEVATGQLAHQAGVTDGDLLLTIAGAPVFRIGEVWAALRLVGGTDRDVTVEYVHDGERRSGAGRVAAVVPCLVDPSVVPEGASLSLDPPWNGSGSSACPTPASRRSTTPSPAAAPSPRPTPSPPPTPTSASPRCPTTGSTRLAAMSASRNVVHAAVQFVDIGGLVEGASKGEGLGNRFLAHIREVDAIVYVLRAFDDGDVPGPTDPLEHLSVVELELCLADLETIEKQLERKRKQAQDRQVGRRRGRRARRRPRRPRPTARRCTGRRCRRSRPRAAAAAVPAHQPARCWPSLNIDEAQLGAGRRGRRAGAGRARRARRGAADLRAARGRGGAARRRGPGRDARGLGLGEGALPRFVQAAYHLLGLRTFLTTGDKESRAWTFRAGCEGARVRRRHPRRPRSGASSGPRSIRWDELLDIGSWNKAKDARQDPGRGQGLRGPGRRRPGDPPQRLTVALARCVTGEVLASLEVASPRRLGARACSVATASRVRCCCDRAVGAHPRHALRHRRRLPRRASCACCGS